MARTSHPSAWQRKPSRLAIARSVVTGALGSLGNCGSGRNSILPTANSLFPTMEAKRRVVAALISDNTKTANQPENASPNTHSDASLKTVGKEMGKVAKAG